MFTDDSFEKKGFDVETFGAESNVAYTVYGIDDMNDLNNMMLWMEGGYYHNKEDAIAEAKEWWDSRNTLPKTVEEDGVVDEMEKIISYGAETFEAETKHTGLYGAETKCSSCSELIKGNELSGLSHRRIGMEGGKLRDDDEYYCRSCWDSFRKADPDWDAETFEARGGKRMYCPNCKTNRTWNSAFKKEKMESGENPYDFIFYVCQKCNYAHDPKKGKKMEDNWREMFGYDAETFEARENKDGTIVLTNNEWDSCIHLYNGNYLWGDLELKLIDDGLKNSAKFKKETIHGYEALRMIRLYERLLRKRNVRSYPNPNKRYSAESFEAESERVCDYCEKEAKDMGMVTFPDGLAVCDICFEEQSGYAETFGAEGMPRLGGQEVWVRVETQKIGNNEGRMDSEIAGRITGYFTSEFAAHTDAKKRLDEYEAIPQRFMNYLHNHPYRSKITVISHLQGGIQNKIEYIATDRHGAESFAVENDPDFDKVKADRNKDGEISDWERTVGNKVAKGIREGRKTSSKGIDTFAEPFEEIGISKPYARLGVIAAGITALAFGVNKLRK